MPEQQPVDDTAVDLTNCDREPIHILGNVQSYGCLIAVSVDWLITHASANCDVHLGLEAEDLIGTRFSDAFSGEVIHTLRTRMQVLTHQDGAARIFGLQLLGDERRFDVSIHQVEAHIVLEFEQRDGDAPSFDDSGTVQALIARVKRQTTLDKMAQTAARGLKMLSGFDRVMVYRFNDDDSGTVIAEMAEAGQTPYKGLRFPASDIPKQARALYTRSLLRLIADVDDTPYPIRPERDPNGNPLDLSLAVTRAVSPIHLEYLRNMGVQASMSVSILRGGKLWGLFACHHRTPLYINYESRSAVELFAQLFNYELDQLELNKELSELDQVRELHDQLMAQLSGGQSMLDIFDVFAESINSVISFDGAAIYSEGTYKSTGSAPTQEEFMGLARFLNTTPAAQVYATNALAERFPRAEGFGDRVAGLLALPISRTPRDYLVLFRREIANSVTWAGNPEKPVDLGPNGIRLTPRKSFDAWQEVVRGQSAAWRDSELRAANALRVTLLEVVLKMAHEQNQQRKRAQDQQELLIAELNHRVRNILNLIRGLVSQGGDTATNIEAYRSVLDARIYSLARAHDQLTQTEWSWTPLHTLIETEVQAFVTAKQSRVVLTGDTLELPPTAFTTLALVIHELVTNSAKYGALNDSRGSVAVDVRLQPDGAASISWREQNGPPVQAPTRRGFGTTIIERSIPFELNGMADIRFRMTGVEADFMIPAPHVRAGTPTEPAAEASAKVVPFVRLDGHCLVLEDNMIIALDASDILHDLGATFVSTASRVSDAMALLDSEDIAFALLDVNLGDEVSLPVLERCLADGIPAILATGYGADTNITSAFPELSIIKKPYGADQVKEVLAQLNIATS
ncbi:MAG: HWE histidine kinase domain-containing protein [Pseudomonadota bacterium]